MNILEELANKLNQMSQEFTFLIEENRKLRAELEDYKSKDDLATRNSQDMILAIKSKLKEKVEF